MNLRIYKSKNTQFPYCIGSQTEELIGLMKNHVPCLHPDCPSEYSVGALKVIIFVVGIYLLNDLSHLHLQEVLNKSIFRRFEKRRQAEEILAAGIEGIN